MLYNRALTVAVGPAGGEGVILSDVRVRFAITRDDTDEPNDIDVSIFNLSAQTRAKFETTDNRLILQAGYTATGLRMLAIGDIVQGITEFNAPDVETRVVAKDGGKALRDARVSVSYEAGVEAKKMVKDLTDTLEVDEVEIGVDLTGAFKYGWSFFGNARDGLNKLAGKFGFQWSIQNNTLQITPKRGVTTREAIYLSASTGMIGSPTRLDRTQENQTKAKEPPGLRVDCLLNPALLPGDTVVIDSAVFPRASYRIKTVDHRGDTHGPDWTTSLEVIDLE